MDPSEQLRRIAEIEAELERLAKMGTAEDVARLAQENEALRAQVERVGGEVPPPLPDDVPAEPAPQPDAPARDFDWRDDSGAAAAQLAVLEERMREARAVVKRVDALRDDAARLQRALGVPYQEAMALEAERERLEKQGATLEELFRARGEVTARRRAAARAEGRSYRVPVLDVEAPPARAPGRDPAARLRDAENDLATVKKIAQRIAELRAELDPPAAAPTPPPAPRPASGSLGSLAFILLVLFVGLAAFIFRECQGHMH